MEQFTEQDLNTLRGLANKARSEEYEKYLKAIGRSVIVGEASDAVKNARKRYESAQRLSGKVLAMHQAKITEEAKATLESGVL